MAKISNTIKVKKDDGTFENIQISYIQPHYCTAEGYQTTASGAASHAEGAETMASGDYSHAEGGGPHYGLIDCFITGTGVADSNGLYEYDITFDDPNLMTDDSFRGSLLGTAIQVGERVSRIQSVSFGTPTGIRTKKSLGSGALDAAQGVIYTGGALGQYSHAEGEQTTASGRVSHAEGFYTIASGKHSHAEGYNTIASGLNSHAEGYETIASGESSHVEGTYCTASGYFSHAEGMDTIASNQGSHAEGFRTEASGWCSHVEGNHTKATVDNSHAEGNYTTASGPNSHAEGRETTAWGDSSHAEGASSNNNVVDFDSVDNDAIIAAWNTNKFTAASGFASHAEGRDTLALAQYAHAEGEQTIAKGNGSHAEGRNTKASGNYSHTSGIDTFAPGEAQFVIGRYNQKFNTQTYNDFAFIIGNGASHTERSNALTVKWDGTVEANNNFIVQNGVSYSGYDSSGTRRPMMWLSSGDDANLIVGNYDSAGHTGHTYINSHNGNVYLRNRNKSLLWQAYDEGGNYNAILRCTVDGEASLGSINYRWYQLFATTPTVSTSDEREKSDIMSIADYPVTYSSNNAGNIFEQLHDKLEPKTYTLDAESTGKIRIGFIAQDIVKALEELGLSEDDLGVINHEYWTDEETGEERDRYGLAYEEFIALNTHIIQKQKVRITELETQLTDQEERITKLEKLINNN